MSLIIHHLGSSQSERLVWLCEELSIPYTLKRYTRMNGVLAPAEYKAMHPAGTSPIIQDVLPSGETVTLAESSACVEYIIGKYGDGRLMLSPSHAAYADFLYWFHWVGATWQTAIGRMMMLSALVGEGESSEQPIVKVMKGRFATGLGMLDQRLREKEWLAGDEFTAADIMLLFSLTTMRLFYGYSLAGFDGILEYLQRVTKREAYIKAMGVCEPGVEWKKMIGSEVVKRT